MWFFGYVRVTCHQISNTHFENVADFRYLGMMATTVLNFTKKELQEVIWDAQEMCVTQNMRYACCRL
jgi:hypothetical protein